MNFLFNSDIVNLLLNTNEWTERQGQNLFFCFVLFFCFFFEVWKALIVGGWVAGGVEEKVLFRAG